MNPKLLEDDARRLFNANKRYATESHKRLDVSAFRRQLIWKIELVPNDTCDGSEFIVKHHNTIYSSNHMSWESAYLSIPEYIRQSNFTKTLGNNNG